MRVGFFLLLCNRLLSVCCPVQVIQFALRDYIQYWYYTLSEDESFLLEIRQTLQNALVQFSTRCTTAGRPASPAVGIQDFIFLILFFLRRSKEVDWQPYFTTRLVDDFATHLRVFRKAQDRLADREDKQSESVCHCVVLLCACVCVGRGEEGGWVRVRGSEVEVRLPVMGVIQQ